MRIEFIFLGVIAAVFLIDFILKGRRTESSTEIIPKTNNKSTNQFKKINWSQLVLINLGIGIITGLSIDFLINYNLYDGDNIIEFYTRRKEHSTLFFNLLGGVFSISILMILKIYILPKISFKTPYFLKYLINRKKNIVLSLILIFLLKLILHYLVYTTTYISYSRQSLEIKGINESLAYHINNIFNEQIILFLPSIIVVLILAWLFNDKIKAR